MKGIFFCSKFPPQAGGAGIDAYYLGKDLSLEGHQIFVVCEHAPGLPKCETLNSNYFIYRFKVPFIKNRGSGIYFILLNLGIALKGIQLILQHHIQVLHGHDTATGIAGLLTKMVTGVPTIFKFGGSMTYEFLSNANKNGWDPAVGEGWVWEQGSGAAKAILAIERQFYIRFDRIYPIAQYLVDLLKKHLPINGCKIKMIHNGVDTDAIRSDKFNSIKSDLGFHKMIFTGIRFVKYKGVHILIQACLPILEELDAHLVIAGSGPEEKALKTMAGGNPRIRFVGSLSWENNMRYVRSADVFVLPSLADKTPSCLLEAMSLETPCIASDINGVKELIPAGAGFLVPPNNPEALREKIVWMLQHPIEASEMGKKGRQHIISEFQWRKTKENIKQLYADLVFIKEPN